MGRIFIKTLMICLSLSLICASASYSKVYYLDGSLSSDITDGSYSVKNRDDTGADGDAYNSLSDFNSIVDPGDIVYIREGVYNNPTFNSSTSGSNANRITFLNYNGEDVFFERGYLIKLDENYYTIEGITFRNKRPGQYRIEITGMHNHVKNCTFDGGGSDYGGIHISGKSANNYEGHNKVENCTFRNWGSVGTDDGTCALELGYGGTKCHHNQIIGCTFETTSSY
ncbi:MAG: chondroitinase-B domain-containing protein, partial [Candidatus Hodarchaeota archaeon]